jgi:hypothetical protein
VPALNHQIDKDVIWQMLQFIPAHDRDTWITIGMALKSELGDGGFSLFDEWSKSPDNYKSKSVISVWKSFKGGAVSIGSLVHLAKKHGWRRGETRQAPLPKVRKVPNQIQNNTHIYALQLWLAADSGDSTVASHQYAIDKGIDWAAGAGRGNASGSIIGKNADCLIVPIRDIETNKVQGVQCINPEGRKQTFGSVSGGALILGNTLDNSLPWYVCEGWASAVSMVFHHQNGNGVCAASFGKSNQKKAAELIAEAHRPKEIIILEEVD